MGVVLAKVPVPLQSCCDMRDQSGKCILQHVSQSIGTPRVMHCVGTGREEERGSVEAGIGRWRRPEGARALYQDGKRCWPIAGVIHSGTNEHVNKVLGARARVPALVSVCGRVPVILPPPSTEPPPPLCNLPRQEAQLWSELCHHFTSSCTPATTKCGRFESVARTKIGFSVGA